MYVKYGAYLGDSMLGNRKWSKRDKSCFEEVKDANEYIKETYFFHTGVQPLVWLAVLGHEKSSKNKKIFGRLWGESWAFHLCVKGKGYYNGTLIEAGSCFMSWPNVKHDIVADADDPFEFYWLILRGRQTMELVQRYGFSVSRLVFKVGCADDMVRLFEIGMNTDYKQFDVYDYTMSLVKMIMSFTKPVDEGAQEPIDIYKHAKNYTSMAKQLLSSANYALTVEEISSKLDISAKHLSRVFYGDTGEPIKQYIIRKRFDFAITLMKEGLPSAEISKLLGYSSYSAYLKMFTSRFSMTPTEYAEKVLHCNYKK